MEAGRYQALPLENRNALEILTTERPQLSKPRNRYAYYPGGSEIPESVAPNIRNRSYTIAVEVTIDTEEAGGVLFCPRIAVRRPRAVHQGPESSSTSTTGSAWTSRSSSRRRTCRPVTSCCRRRSSERADSMPAPGHAHARTSARTRSARRIKTQPGKFSIAGEGSTSARKGAEPVTDDYRVITVGVRRRHDREGGDRRQRRSCSSISPAKRRWRSRGTRPRRR